MTARRLAHIRSVESFLSSAPDLSAYQSCFDGFASSRFTGTDLDGIFVASWAGHGMWERGGYSLIQEHKSCPEALASSRGQWMALNSLASIPTKARLSVIVTFGDPDAPSAWKRLPVADWRRLRSRDDFAAMQVWAIKLHDIETWPHRQWIRWVSKRMGDR